MRLLLLALFFYSAACFAQQKTTNDQTSIDSAAFKKSMMAQKKVQAKTLSSLKKESANKLTPLLEKFTFKKVAGTDKGWYRHKIQKDTAQPWLEAPVNASGYIYLKATYTGTVSYNIYSFTIKTELGEVYAKPLTKDSPYIFRKKRGAKFNENLHLFPYRNESTEELSAMYLLELIAKTNAKQKVTLKFIGEKENIEFTLSKENIKAIKESWELSQYLCYNGNNYLIYSGPFPISSKKNHSAFLYSKDELTKDDMKGIERY